MMNLIKMIKMMRLSFVMIRINRLVCVFNVKSIEIYIYLNVFYT